MPNVKPRPSCSVPDCDSPNQAQGLCSKHRARLLRHGDVNYGEPEWRYHNSYLRGDPTECWEWQKGLTEDGYGKFKAHGVTWVATRYGWTLRHGSIPDEMIVCHTCDNPPCQNPAHLFLGTHKDNSDDKLAKGRGLFDQPKDPATGQFTERGKGQ